MTLNVGVIRFPGSNCDFDTLKWFRNAGHNASFVWYNDTKLSRVNLIVLPGGFAFGDRTYENATDSYLINPGVQAVKSPIMKRVIASGVPILGICNGFQILTHAGLLPGKLVRNKSRKFYCNNTTCRVVGPSFFRSKDLLNKDLTIPVAHGYGRYTCTWTELRHIEKDGLVFLRYLDNPNGSVDDIAGICNRSQTVFGMMPHPERAPSSELFIQAIERCLLSKAN